MKSLNSWGQIFLDCGIFADSWGYYFMDASIFSFCKKSNSFKIYFVDDVNLLGRATLEYNENWATTNSKHSIVFQESEVIDLSYTKMLIFFTVLVFELFSFPKCVLYYFALLFLFFNIFVLSILSIFWGTYTFYIIYTS